MVPASGLIKQAGWNIRYIAGRDAGRSYLELYAMNRMTKDRHLRVYEDGAVETLPAVSQGVTFSPDIAGDRDRAEREQKEIDDRLITELRERGLW